MVLVADERVVFGRDQVISSSQAAKNFGAIRRRAAAGPVYVADRSAGIDTVIVSFAQFEEMALELDKYRQAKLYKLAEERLERANSTKKHKGIALDDKTVARLKKLDTETVSDAEMFE